MTGTRPVLESRAEPAECPVCGDAVDRCVAVEEIHEPHRPVGRLFWHSDGRVHFTPFSDGVRTSGETPAGGVWEWLVGRDPVVAGFCALAGGGIFLFLVALFVPAIDDNRVVAILPYFAAAVVAVAAWVRKRLAAREADGR